MASIAGTNRSVTAGSPAEASVKLKANELTLWDSTVIAVTSTAPAYSLAATMAAMIAATGVGLASPAAILVSFVPVLGIAIAYFYMNSTNPNCGASYSWLTQAISPWFGWFTGWVQIVASVVFIIIAPALAGTNTLDLLNRIGWISSSTVTNGWAIALVGIAWLIFVTLLVIVGVQVAARFQAVMLVIEYGALIIFSIAAFIKVATSHPKGSTPFTWTWLNPFSIHGLEGLAAGTALAVFFFWGWDTAANVNEESKNARYSPGQAGIIGMFVLLLVFILSSVAMQMVLPEKTISAQGSNALQYFASQVLPGGWSYIMVLAILSSTVATLQTTLLPAARLTLSMSRDRVWPRVFGAISPRFQTPVLGTLLLAGICIVGLLLTTASPNINTLLQNSYLNIGVLVGFYYGITGIACAWYFRRVLTRNARTLFFAGIFPAVSGIFLFWVGVQVVIQGEQSGGWGSVLPVLVAFIMGIPLTVVAYLNNQRYFTYRAEAYEPGKELPVGAILDGSESVRAR